MSVIGADRDARPPVRGGLFRKYLVSFLVVVSAALIANNVIDAIFSYREQQRLLIAVQREQASAAADKIDQFLKEIERQLVWLSQLSLQMLPPEEMRITGIRLHGAPAQVKAGLKAGIGGIEQVLPDLGERGLAESYRPVRQLAHRQ